MKKWKAYAFWIILCEAVGALSSWLTRDGIRVYQAGPKPAISPPGIVFGIVWTVLFALMGFAGGRVTLAARAGQSRWKGLNLLIVQLAVNFCWPILFFNLRAYAFSHIWLLLLLGLVVWMTLEFRKADRLAALSQIPYIAWLCFAAVLNERVMRM